MSTDTPGTDEGAPESERPPQSQNEEELDFERVLRATLRFVESYYGYAAEDICIST